MLNLPQKEFALLLLLVQSEDKEVPPHELYEKVWGTPLERISVPYGFTSRIYAGKSTRMMRMIMISFPYTGRGICSLRCAETKSSEI